MVEKENENSVYFSVYIFRDKEDMRRKKEGIRNEVSAMSSTSQRKKMSREFSKSWEQGEKEF